MTSASDTKGPGWYVYLLRSERRRTSYVGIARDVTARLAQHNGEQPGGAKSTRAARPWRVDRVEGPFPDRGAAQSAEAQMRRRRGQGELDEPRDTGGA